MTVIFTDNFESGDFSLWSSTFGSVSVNDVVKRIGQKAMYAPVALSSSKYVSRTHSAQTSIFLRFYIYLGNYECDSTTWEYMIARCGFTSVRPIVSIYNDGTAFHWRMRDGAGALKTSTSIIELNTWYCVEVKGVVGDESALFVNGEKVLVGAAPLNSSSTFSLVVQRTSGVLYNADVYYDDVVLSDSYVGPYTDINMLESITVVDSSFLNKIYRFVESSALIDKLKIIDSSSYRVNLSVRSFMGLNYTATPYVTLQRTTIPYNNLSESVEAYNVVSKSVDSFGKLNLVIKKIPPPSET